MRKTFLLSAILIAMALLLPSCRKAEGAEATRSAAEPRATSAQASSGQVPAAQVPPVLVPEDSDSPDRDDADDGYQRVKVAGTEVLWDGYRAIEPDSRLDITSMDFSDFGISVTGEYPVTRETYSIMEGTVMETEVVHIHSAGAGPAIYIVGGVHGDEKAAWYCATLMRDITISCGDLYILVPANANGARNDTRYVVDRQDLNRSFPGDPDGNEAEALADAIFTDIKRIRPDLVLDLHEAIVMTQSRDFLGSTYIFTDLSGMEDLFFDLLFATQDGTICHNEFGYTGPGPDGSVNAEVTRRLHIPVITVETFRGFDIYRRVHDQLDTVLFVLSYNGMR